MRKKINYEKVTFLGGFGGEPPKKKEIRSLQLLRFQFTPNMTLPCLIVQYVTLLDRPAISCPGTGKSVSYFLTICE